MTNKKYTELIKSEAFRLGFDAYGIAKADFVEEHAVFLKNWLEKDYQAGMSYMNNHFEKRCDPTLLVENAKSVIVVALNYYPEKKQDEKLPQIAYYAYGNDYHPVIKGKLQQLLSYINGNIAPVSGRCFTDSAPVLERYWATQAGIGFIGKNNQLIIPQKGSYFFLGELIIDLPLEYDTPIEKNSCGRCSKCLDACPTKALEKPFCLNANNCISYLTIENKEDIDNRFYPILKNKLFGCDICQQVCPWNRFAKPHSNQEFYPNKLLLEKDSDEWLKMNNGEFLTIARNSPLMRTGLEKLQQTIRALDKTT